MPPKFLSSNFKFEAGRALPDHVEEYPDTATKDPQKIWLEGEDRFSYEFYPLAVDIDDLPTAALLKAARLRHLEETQPSETSGGQAFGGIQDGAHIRIPR